MKKHLCLAVVIFAIFSIGYATEDVLYSKDAVQLVKVYKTSKEFPPVEVNGSMMYLKVVDQIWIHRDEVSSFLAANPETADYKWMTMREYQDLKQKYLDLRMSEQITTPQPPSKTPITPAHPDIQQQLSQMNQTLMEHEQRLSWLEQKVAWLMEKVTTVLQYVKDTFGLEF